MARTMLDKLTEELRLAIKHSMRVIQGADGVKSCMLVCRSAADKTSARQGEDKHVHVHIVDVHLVDGVS